MKSKLFLSIIVLAVVLGAFTAYFQTRPTTNTSTTYREIDMQNGISQCMTIEYAKRYQDTLPEKDVMPICRARWQTVTQTISYDTFKEHLLETPYQRKESDATKKIRKLYGDILMGVPIEEVSVPKPQEVQ